MARQYTRQVFLEALDAYDQAFSWIGLCLACGHAPADTHAGMQRLVLAHQRLRPGVDIYPLLSAHWDVVNAAEAVAAAPNRRERDARQTLVRRARVTHAQVLRRLRGELQPATPAAVVRSAAVPARTARAAARPGSGAGR